MFALTTNKVNEIPNKYWQGPFSKRLKGITTGCSPRCFLSAFGVLDPLLRGLGKLGDIGGDSSASSRQLLFCPYKRCLKWLCLKECSVRWADAIPLIYPSRSDQIRQTSVFNSQFSAVCERDKSTPGWIAALRFCVLPDCSIDRWYTFLLSKCFGRRCCLCGCSSNGGKKYLELLKKNPTFD